MIETPEKKGTHHHFSTKKEMKEAMRLNWNAWDTFSYGKLLPVPTGMFRHFLKKYEEQIEQMLFKEIEKNR